MHKKLILFYVYIHICFVLCMCHTFEKGDSQQSLWFLSWEYVPVNFFLSCQTAEKTSNCTISVNFINFSPFGVHHFFMLLSLKGLKAWVFKCGYLKSGVLNADVKQFFFKQQINSKKKKPKTNEINVTKQKTLLVSSLVRLPNLHLSTRCPGFL